MLSVLLCLWYVLCVGLLFCFVCLPWLLGVDVLVYLLFRGLFLLVLLWLLWLFGQFVLCLVPLLGRLVVSFLFVPFLFYCVCGRHAGRPLVSMSGSPLVLVC